MHRLFLNSIFGQIVVDARCIMLASTDGEVYNAILACLKDDKDKKFFSLEMREKYNVIT